MKNNKKIITALVTLLLLPTIINSQGTTIQSTDNDINFIYVDDNNTEGPWDGTLNNPYQFINDGVQNSTPGDIIYVFTGIYYENILIDKQLTIMGENKTNTIINGMYKEKIVSIIADNVILTNFTLKNSNGSKGNTAVYIESDNATISNCIIYRTRTGIIIDNSNNTNIKNCLFHTNGEAILAENAYNIRIQDSELCHNGIGTDIQKSKNIIIENSYAHENSVPFLFNTSSNIEIVSSASCDNNDNGGGIFVYDSYNINFENCNIIHNGAGFKITNSTNLYFDRCNLENTTHFTIWIQEKSDNILIDQCNIINNMRHGVHITDSNCKITNSNMYGNSIESVTTINSFVSAKNNWWGSKLGPVFSKGFRLIDILSKDFGKIIYYPWSTTQFENIGSNWIVEEKFEKTIIHGYGDDPIKLEGNDTDFDGLPDWWEEEFGYNVTVWDDHLNLDPDGDKLNNFEECYAYNWGAKPNKKDVFVEIDRTPSGTSGASNILPDEYITKMADRFAEHDIILHVDQGSLGGGEEIPYITNFSFDELVDLYWNYFLHNDLNNPRKNIFHYGIVCDVGPGNGFMFTGWAHLNAFCISAQVLYEQHPKFDRGFLISAGSMHELGHTLGLIADDFGGIDNHANMYPKYIEFWRYLNYRSLMSYQYTYFVFDYSDGDNRKNDFDDWGNMEFDFFKNTHLEWPKN